MALSLKEKHFFEVFLDTKWIILNQHFLHWEKEKHRLIQNYEIKYHIEFLFSRNSSWDTMHNVSFAYFTTFRRRFDIIQGYYYDSGRVYKWNRYNHVWMKIFNWSPPYYRVVAVRVEHCWKILFNQWNI